MGCSPQWPWSIPTILQRLDEARREVDSYESVEFTSLVANLGANETVSLEDQHLHLVHSLSGELLCICSFSGASLQRKKPLNKLSSDKRVTSGGATVFMYDTGDIGPMSKDAKPSWAAS